MSIRITWGLSLDADSTIPTDPQQRALWAAQHVYEFVKASPELVRVFEVILDDGSLWVVDPVERVARLAEPARPRKHLLSLADDGTLDTVFSCDACGKEFRYTYSGEGGQDYADFLGWSLADAELEHAQEVE